MIFGEQFSLMLFAGAFRLLDAVVLYGLLVLFTNRSFSPFFFIYAARLSSTLSTLIVMRPIHTG